MMEKNRYKTIVVFIVLCVVLLFAFSSYAEDTADHWAAKSIELLVKKCIIKGDERGNIDPDNFITRSEFVKMINKTFDYSDKDDSNFLDVSKEKWYYNEFSIAKKRGYILGDDDGKLNPERNITRAEAAVLLTRVLQLKNEEGDVPFMDVETIPSWALESVRAMYKGNLINGYSNGAFKPEDSMTRSEGFTLIANMLNQGLVFEKDFVITIPDEYLKKELVKRLNLNSEAEVHYSDVRYVSKLEMNSAAVTNLEGLQYFKNLESLTIYHSSNIQHDYNYLSDISILSELGSLKHLELWVLPVKDISPIRSLTNLESLKIHLVPVNDIKALSELKRLTDLTLTADGISDVSPLAGLSELVNLNMRGNEITDISALAGLNNLTTLTLNDNDIKDVSVLASLPSLKKLYITHNFNIDPATVSKLTNVNVLHIRVKEVGYLSGLMNLTELGWYSGENPMSINTDISPLAELTNLRKLQIYAVNLKDISPLSSLKNLTELYIDFCEISDISPIAELTKMTKLTLKQCQGIKNIRALAGLKDLTYLDLYGDRITDISPLENLTALTYLDLTYNYISDIRVLLKLVNLKEIKIVKEWIASNEKNLEVFKVLKEKEICR